MNDDPGTADAKPAPEAEPSYRGMTRLQITAAVIELCYTRAKNGEPPLTHDQIVEMMFPGCMPEQRWNIRSIVKQARFLELYSSRWPYSGKSPSERRSLTKDGQMFGCTIELEDRHGVWLKGQFPPPQNAGRLYIDQPKTKLFADRLDLWAPEGKAPAVYHIQDFEGLERKVAAFVQSELRKTRRWDDTGPKFGDLEGPSRLHSKVRAGPSGLHYYQKDVLDKLRGGPKKNPLAVMNQAFGVYAGNLLPLSSKGRLNPVLTAILVAYRTDHQPPVASFTLQPISARSSAYGISSILFHPRIRGQHVKVKTVD